MSAISEKVRIALFEKLNVSGVTTLATGGVHHQLAPESAELPYVIFHRQASRDVAYNFGFTLSHEDDFWLIKAVTDENSSDTKEPAELAEDILEACETAIGDELTLTGSETWVVNRVRDIPNYYQTQSDRAIHYHGFLLRVVAANV